jgi:transposase
VTHPCRYEPDLNPTYQDLAMYYSTAVIPARVRKARDKAKVESAVLIAERWIVVALRNHTFFSIGELNRAIKGEAGRVQQPALAEAEGIEETPLRDHR